MAFPKIPGVRFPTEFSPAWRLDFGPAWKRGIIEVQPPVVGETSPVLLPQVDADGNDLGGVRIPEMMVPLATCTGWNLRDPTIGAPEMRASFVGSYLPFAATAAARRNSGDPRTALDERYTSEADYLARFQRAAAQLNTDHGILDEDLPAVLQRAKQEWKAVQDLVGKS